MCATQWENALRCAAQIINMIIKWVCHFPGYQSSCASFWIYFTPFTLLGRFQLVNIALMVLFFEDLDRLKA